MSEIRHGNKTEKFEDERNLLEGLDFGDGGQSDSYNPEKQKIVSDNCIDVERERKKIERAFAKPPESLRENKAKKYEEEIVRFSNKFDLTHEQAGDMVRATRKLSFALWRIWNKKENDVTPGLQEDLDGAYEVYCNQIEQLQTQGKKVERKVDCIERDGKKYYVVKQANLPKLEKKLLKWFFGEDFLGWAKTGNIALVKEGLPKTVEGFITEHELFHCRDGWHSGNRIIDYVVREIRAQFAVNIKHPIGYLATSFYNLGRNLKKLKDKLF